LQIDRIVHWYHHFTLGSVIAVYSILRSKQTAEVLNKRAWGIAQTSANAMPIFPLCLPGGRTIFGRCFLYKEERCSVATTTQYDDLFHIRQSSKPIFYENLAQTGLDLTFFKILSQICF